MTVQAICTEGTSCPAVKQNVENVIVSAMILNLTWPRFMESDKIFRQKFSLLSGLPHRRQTLYWGVLPMMFQGPFQSRFQLDFETNLMVDV